MLPDCPKTLENRMTLPTDPMYTKGILSKLISTSCSSIEDHPNLIIPGIYSTNRLDTWTPEKLRSYGFTHIINIDEHIRDIDSNLERRKTMTLITTIEGIINPIKSSSISCTYNNSSSNNNNSNNNNSNNNNPNNSNSNNINLNNNLDRRYKNSNDTDHYLSKNNSNSEEDNLSSSSTAGSLLPELSSGGALQLNSHLHLIRAEFEILDLNFGEESYLMTVLPNCYKAVKFIEKALQNGGFILIVDSNSNQKCLTIVTAYLMYKNNINFNEAFQRIKGIFRKAELEKFFISQLYEYEPILQVQKALARGHSCSRELRSAFLKRKKMYDDTISIGGNSRQNGGSDFHFISYSTNSNNFPHHDNGDVIME